MFLVTTADRRLWKTGEPLLFLGEWCRLYRDRAAWENVPGRVVPYHWDDRDTLARDVAALGKLIDRMHASLATALNQQHGTAHSARYWKVLTGPWLVYFVGVLFDRFRALEEAARDGATATWLPRVGSFRHTVPNGFDELHGVLGDDPYNLFLYDWLVRRMSEISFEEKDLSIDLFPPATPRKASRKEKLVDWQQRVRRVVPTSLKRICLFNVYEGQGRAAALHLALGQVPQLDLPPRVEVWAASAKETRAAFRAALAGAFAPENRFEALLPEIIAAQVPTVHLEGYGEARTRSLAAYPRNPRVVVTATGHLGNEAMKVWLAESVAQGTRLVINQHGGHTGSGRFCLKEDHDLAIADCYLSWGWQGEKLRPTASGKLTAGSRKLRARSSGSILLAANTFFRYSHRLFSIPIASQVAGYIDEQFRFVAALNAPAKGLLEVRLYPRDFGWNEKERWQDRFPEVRLYQGKMPFHQHLQQCRLHVGTHNTTTPLETLTAGFPTVLFWNPNHWELRDEARPVFASLREVGILHDTPESAARLVSEIFDHVEEWWQASTRRKAVREFCDRLAITSPDWKRQWVDALREVEQR